MYCVCEWNTGTSKNKWNILSILLEINGGKAYITTSFLEEAERKL